ncbi:MAG: MBL fold metallo-hydrolase [Clostridia bacterium]|nr:MBL fold metallo-hydrolase [Clostridia bacterium]
MSYEIIKINETTYRIEEDHVRFFFLIGNQRALLVDSGLSVTNTREIAESLTDLPVSLLNTHSDPDHIACNHQFESFYMHEADSFFYFNIMPKPGKLLPLKDGEIIDLGDRPLEIVTLPGHTPGSVGVLDINHRVLISGDPIQDGMIFMFGPGRDMTAYRDSLRKLDGYRSRFDSIYPSHGTFPVEKELIDHLYEVTADLSKYPHRDMDMHGQIVDCVDTGIAKFLISQKK